MSNFPRLIVSSATCLGLLSACSSMKGSSSESTGNLDADALLSASDVSIQELLSHPDFLSSTRLMGKACLEGIGQTPKRVSDVIVAPPPSWPEWAAMPVLNTFFRRYVFVESIKNPAQVYLIRDTNDYPAPECNGPFERSKVARFLNTK